MLLIGEFISVEETRPQGRANGMVLVKADDGAADASLHLIFGKPQAASVMGKALLFKQQGFGFDAAYRLASQAVALNMMPFGERQGTRALIEKRRPQWPAAVR